MSFGVGSHRRVLELSSTTRQEAKTQHLELDEASLQTHMPHSLTTLAPGDRSRTVTVPVRRRQLESVRLVVGSGIVCWGNSQLARVPIGLWKILSCRTGVAISSRQGTSDLEKGKKVQYRELEPAGEPESSCKPVETRHLSKQQQKKRKDQSSRSRAAPSPLNQLTFVPIKRRVERIRINIDRRIDYCIIWIVRSPLGGLTDLPYSFRLDQPGFDEILNQSRERF